MNKGISRNFRENSALSSKYIQPDERSIKDMIISTMNLAKQLNYFDESNNLDGDWESFLLYDPIFINVKISATPLSKYKKTNDDFKKEVINTNGKFDDVNKIEDYLYNFFELPKLVNDWNKLLNYSTNTNFLSEEIRNLRNSIDQSLKLHLHDSEEKDIPKSDLYIALIEKIKSFYQFQDSKSNDMNIERLYVEANWKLSEENNFGEYFVYDAFDDIYGKVLFFQETVNRRIQDLKFDQNHAPHIGLLLSFFRLFEFLQHDVNTLTKRHLDYYYQNILHQKQNKKFEAHSALISCTLKKGVEDFVVPKGETFTFDFGGGRKLAFLAQDDTPLNQTVVTDVKSVFNREVYPFDSENSINAFKYNILYKADILDNLDSKNNLRTEHLEDFPLTFGGDTICDIGFMVSSPVLLLEKGKQKITIEINLETSFKEVPTFKTLGDNLKKEFDKILLAFQKSPFNVYITSKEGWKEITNAKVTLNRKTYKSIEISFELFELRDQMISFDPTIHSGEYDTTWPCIKILINNSETYNPYIFLKDLEINNLTIESEVYDVDYFKLSNVNGNIDHTIPFTPFGSIPEIGSFLRIQNPLILNRHLSELKLHINWNGLPHLDQGFEAYYKEYLMGIKNDSFKAKVSQLRNLPESKELKNSNEFDLFTLDEDHLPNPLVTINVDLRYLQLERDIKQFEGKVEENEESLYITFCQPEQFGFGHSLYPDIYAKTAMKNSRFFKKATPLPKQPYTPVIDHLSSDYKCKVKEKMLRRQDENSTTIKFFHVHPYGHVKVFPGSVNSACHLIPQFYQNGNFLIGLENVTAESIVNIGIDMIPAVKVHTVVELPKITWTYLYNNEWNDLSDYILEDSTNGLIKTGIIRIELPVSLQLEHTRLPSGKFWIRASFSNVENGTSDIPNSRIKEVFAQAIALSSTEHLPFDLHKEEVVQEGIKIIAPRSLSLAKIDRPRDLMLNHNMEEDATYYSRVSELLRHKNRGVTNWDLERLLLEKFSFIEKIRVYGRNSYPNELVNGSSIQIVVIPKSASHDDHLFEARKLDVDSLHSIKTYAEKYLSPHAKVEVCNTVFERLKIRCRVIFHEEHKSSALRYRLNQDLVRFLSPNLKDFDSDELFDKSFSKAEIFNFIQSRPYVKYVNPKRFSIIQLVKVFDKHRIIDSEDGKDKIKDDTENTRSLFQTISAYALLTSVDKHHIEIERIPNKTTYIQGIGDVAIGTDLIIADKNGSYI